MRNHRAHRGLVNRSGGARSWKDNEDGKVAYINILKPSVGQELTGKFSAFFFFHDVVVASSQEQNESSEGVFSDIEHANEVGKAGATSLWEKEDVEVPGGESGSVIVRPMGQQNVQSSTPKQYWAPERVERSGYALALADQTSAQRGRMGKSEVRPLAKVEINIRLPLPANMRTFRRSVCCTPMSERKCATSLEC